MADKSSVTKTVKRKLNDTLLICLIPLSNKTLNKDSDMKKDIENH